MITASKWRLAIWLASCLVNSLWAAPSFAQSFDADLLDRARAASKMIPGSRPREVRFQSFSEWSAPLSQYIEASTDSPVLWVAGVFQIRFGNGWIVVDAGADETSAGSDSFSDASYKAYEEVLSRANMIVITHEHADHARGLVRGSSAKVAAERALLTVEQVDSMLAAQSDWIAEISAEQADRFMVLGYEELLPIASGVVLIKSPGHTKGSQMVFVVLASGEELLFVGDVVWHESQIDTGNPKSANWAELGEDQRALKTQIGWLREVSKTNIHVVIAHDHSALKEQLSDGVLVDGLYLPKQD